MPLSSQQLRILIQFYFFFFSCARLQQWRYVGCGVGGKRGGGVGVGIKGFYVCNKDSHTNKTWKKQATKTKMTIRAKAMLALNEQSMTKSLLY